LDKLQIPNSKHQRKTKHQKKSVEKNGFLWNKSRIALTPALSDPIGEGDTSDAVFEVKRIPSVQKPNARIAWGSRRS
jgi:hypothetical protein